MWKNIPNGKNDWLDYGNVVQNEKFSMENSELAKSVVQFMEIFSKTKTYRLEIFSKLAKMVGNNMEKLPRCLKFSLTT